MSKHNNTLVIAHSGLGRFRAPQYWRYSSQIYWYIKVENDVS
jgi:hypothetical protein